MIEPAAASTAGLTKFSEAINSRPFCCRFCSSWMARAIWGSVAARSRMRMLQRGDFVEPALVTAAGKLRIEKRVHNLACQWHRSDALTEGQHVRIVVFAATARRCFVGDRRRPHARQLVGGHRHANARSAEEDAVIEAAVRH